MEVKQVHHQTAKKILRKHSYLISPEYAVDTYTVEEIYFRIKHGENHLLRTGAKMFYEKGKCYVSGYAMDGSDVEKLFL